MRSKFLTLAVGTGMLMSVAGVATAHHQEGHEANYHGMCTAYFSGSENGQGKKQQNGNAFIVFAETVGDYDQDGDRDQHDIAAFCLDNTGGFGNPGQGNDAYFPDSSDCGSDDATCEEIENHPGGTGDGNNGKKKD